MFINKQYNNFLEVLDLGYLDHFAQILFFFMNRVIDWKKSEEEILKIFNIYQKMNHGERLINSFIQYSRDPPKWI
jgi:hypothetical protein